MSYHKPVLLRESVEGLNINPDGVYVDVTFGGGGHSAEILKKLSVNGRLYAFDQDADAAANVPDDGRFVLIRQNFRYLRKYLKFYNALPIDGLLADLGISSHQIDVPERGFSTRHDANLDMRMDVNAPLTARKIVNTYTEEQLQAVFSSYGEIINSRTLARTLVAERQKEPVATVSGLKKAIAPCVTRGKENQYYAQVFQALRIEVNQELEVLKELLVQSGEVLKKGGRLVVISYHSLEDRLVKNYINKGKFEGEVEKDIFGNPEGVPLKAVSRKPVEAGEEEVRDNPRSRSAKLRIAEKN
jgi:16S rRNA (cytosine1402-N4)-methyltransferase